MLKFYGHFAAAYGTIWFFLMLFAVLTQSRIDALLFGLIGFPIIALIYACIRMAASPAPDNRNFGPSHLTGDVFGEIGTAHELERRGETEQATVIYERLASRLAGTPDGDYAAGCADRLRREKAPNSTA
jgi:hypothetical protein